MKTIFFSLAMMIVFASCTTHEHAPAYSSSGHVNARLMNDGGGQNERFDNAFSSTEKSFYKAKYVSDEKAERMIIYNADLDLTVKTPDSANKAIGTIAKDLGGYVQSMGTHKTVIRIKSENLNKAIEAISKLGKITHKNLSGQDVSEDYFDLQVRVENAEKARKRYLELLEKAVNVDEALKVERELERLNKEIDLLKGKANKLQHLSEFSTLNIYLQEKKKLGILGYIAVGTYKVVKWFFVRN